MAHSTRRAGWNARPEKRTLCPMGRIEDEEAKEKMLVMLLPRGADCSDSTPATVPQS